MTRFEKPAEGTWTEHYPGLGTGRVSFEDSISPAFYELEREAIFERAWLYAGRLEQLPRNGSYFTKELPGLGTSIIVARDLNGRVRAFHNVCRHRGNKLVWDAGTLDGTQMGLEQRAFAEFPLNDREILVRHFHKTVGEWVDAWSRERAERPSR